MMYAALDRIGISVSPWRCLRDQHVLMPPRAAASSFSFKPRSAARVPQRDLAGHGDIVPDRDAGL